MQLQAAVTLVLLSASAGAQTCSLVSDLAPGGSPSSPNEITCLFGDQLFFSASDSFIGHEPYWLRGQGTPVLVDDIQSSGGSDPRGFAVCGRNIVFSAVTSGSGRELWITDRTTAGTLQLRDIYPGGLGSDPQSLVTVGDRVFFTADDGTHGRELWITDGTPAGTQLVEDILPGSIGSAPADLVDYGGILLFSANDGFVGRELWRSSGDSLGTYLIKDINAGINNSNPEELTLHDSLVFFRARDPILGIELFETDGSMGGTRLVADLNGAGSSTPSSFASCGDKLFFSAASLNYGAELWVRDAGGIRLVRDLRPGPAPSSPAELTCAGDRVFFRADDGTSGVELWVSDGTTAGTSMPLDIQGGNASSAPSDFVGLGERTYFVADDGTGSGLWTSDGTAPGTQRVGTVTAPRGLVVCDCDVYLAAYDPNVSVELFAVRAPGANVQPVASTCPTALTFDATLPRLGSTMSFSGRSVPSGWYGLLLLDLQLRDPIPLPGGCSGPVLPLFMAALPPGPSWAVGVPIPDEPLLDGEALASQAWFLDPVATSLKPTRALLVGLGR